MQYIIIIAMVAFTYVTAKGKELNSKNKWFVAMPTICIAISLVLGDYAGLERKYE